MRTFPLLMLGLFFGFVGAGRMALHRWRYGKWGWARARGRPIDWAQGALILGAVALGAEALILALRPQWLGALALPAQAGGPYPLAGGLLSGGALVLILVAQLQMGQSWRIGIDEADRTELITRGLYAHCRNPIYVGLVLGLVAFTLAVPTWLSVGLVLFAATCIRSIVRREEAYLRHVHGAAFAAYAARVPRF
jgi:protein-S-isoprenylcysteine O-methyltransferase Ste14